MTAVLLYVCIMKPEKAAARCIPIRIASVLSNGRAGVTTKQKNTLPHALSQKQKSNHLSLTGRTLVQI